MALKFTVHASFYICITWAFKYVHFMKVLRVKAKNVFTNNSIGPSQFNGIHSLTVKNRFWGLNGI